MANYAVHTIESQYLRLLKDLTQSRDVTIKSDRTGTGTFSLFGRQISGDVGYDEGFPLLTTKKVHFRSVVEELLWMLRGETNVRSLNERGVTIWDEWADKNGELGPVYGAQWRAWRTSPEIALDQIAQAQWLLQNDPDSRRIIVSAWNVGQIGQMALMPCHAFFQFYTRPIGDRCYLDLHLYQRSADIFLGVPFNIASYALLIHLMAHTVKMWPGRLTISFGDVHLYKNHAAAALEQLRRPAKQAPGLIIQPEHPRDNVWEYASGDIFLQEYHPHPAIKAPVAV